MNGKVPIKKPTAMARIAVFLGATVATFGLLLLYNGLLARTEHDPDRTRHRVVFADAALQQPLGILPPGGDSEFANRDGVWTGFRAKAGKYTPIIRWSRVYRIKDGGGRDGHVAPNVTYETANQTGRPANPLFRKIMAVATSILVGGGVVLLACARITFARLVVALGLLRIASLCWTFALFGYFTVHAADESFYYGIADKLLHWSHQHDEYPYTLGNPLLYALFWPAFGHLSEFGFIGAVGTVFFILFGIGVIVVFTGFLWSVVKSTRAAVAGGLLMVLYPWVMRMYHMPNAPIDIFTYFGLWFKYPVDVAYIDFYYFTDLVGYNAMSDSPALVFGFGALLLLYRNIRTNRSLVLPGLLLGLSCLTRIAGIFYLVPAGFIVVKCITSENRLRLPGCIAGFMVMALPQLIWNGVIFGNPFTLGYSYRKLDAQGFEFSRLMQGIDMYGSAYHQLFCFAALGLWLGSKLRPFAAAWLALAIWPTLYFYSGYYAIGYNPVRFILLPLFAMLAACGLPAMTAKLDHARWVLTIAAAAVTAAFIPGTPYAAYLAEVPENLCPILCLVLAGIAWLWARDWAFAVFFVVFGLGVPPLTYGMLTVVCLAVVAKQLTIMWRQRKARTVPVSA